MGLAAKQISKNVPKDVAINDNEIMAAFNSRIFNNGS